MSEYVLIIVPLITGFVVGCILENLYKQHTYRAYKSLEGKLGFCPNCEEEGWISTNYTTHLNEGEIRYNKKTKAWECWECA